MSPVIRDTDFSLILAFLVHTYVQICISIVYHKRFYLYVHEHNKPPGLLRESELEFISHN